MPTAPLPRQLRAAFWDLHSRTWDAGAPPAAVAARTADLLAWVRAYAPPGARVLDVGCATGTHALALAAAGYAVTGADVSAGMLARARAKAAADPRPGVGGSVEFCRWDPEVRPDGGPLPAPRGYAVALCAGVLQCAVEPAAFLAAVARALAPSGVVLVEVKDAAADLPPRPGHSAASRAFAPLKRWASRSPAVRRVTRERLTADLAAAGLRPVGDRSGGGWLRVAAETVSQGVEAVESAGTPRDACVPLS